MVCIYKDMLMKIRKNNLLTITVLTSATGHHMAVFGVYTYFLFLMIPCGSDGKESACNVGDLGSIPVLGRSPGMGMATHFGILAWRIPWTVEPGRLQSMRSKRVRQKNTVYFLLLHRQKYKAWNYREHISNHLKASSLLYKRTGRHWFQALLLSKQLVKGRAKSMQKLWYK